MNIQVVPAAVALAGEVRDGSHVDAPVDVPVDAHDGPHDGPHDGFPDGFRDGGRQIAGSAAPAAAGSAGSPSSPVPPLPAAPAAVTAVALQRGGYLDQGGHVDPQPRSGSAYDLATVVVVQVAGEVDLYTGPELRQVLADLLPPAGKPRPVRSAGSGLRPASVAVSPAVAELQVCAVVVDLRGVDFMDSYALGVLVHGHRLARPGGRSYSLVATSGLIRKLFALTGLSRVMPLHPGLLSALDRLQPADPRLHGPRSAQQ